MAVGAAPLGSASGRGNRAVFLDKDGTLLENLPYNVDPGRMRLSPGALAGAGLLAQAGYLLFVVSNQSGVARGLFPEEALAPVFRKLDELLAARGITLAGHYYCPHHPRGVVPGYTEVCGCRKPESGMLLQAAREYDLDLGACWLVGDILDDVEAGRRAGCRTVLLDNGNETEWVMPPQRRPHAMARDLEEAAQLILAADALALGAGGTPLHAEGRAADGRQRACR